MVDMRDLRRAMEASKIRVMAVEERYILSALSDTEKRLDAFCAKEKGEREKREPYEFI